ncbi:cyclic nucleotide-binding domain-containing protein [Lyngbya confervoides]|uniref:Cyclic nucleotide-binding domain-containing protein n=1 Tax=Lyngbya confervoides BDU141951 TaxID=1574623 RepID=A0ABD4T379_9CYAN|nr:cyclic nucleotide-binding domain-containing protein [Lyngbya confervoides]MCM1982943.1 cyclic nucleotide-binding domain-containing protein [Lyngbya confervoides BDU141951]
MSGRLGQLWLLAVTVLAYSVLEMAIANSLFLTHVGAYQLPLVFICIGLGSLPAYTFFSQVVDRYSRPQLFRIMLGVAIGVSLGLRGFIALDIPGIYYLLMILLFFQWDFHNTLLYSSLLTDYFTATEYKQLAPLIGIGQAVGMLLGGSITLGLSRIIPTANLLFVVPILLGLAMVQLFILEKTHTQVVAAPSSPRIKIGLLENLHTFPGLVRQYPLMLFLAASSFLLVIIYLTSEYLWFSVYEQHFTSDQLTQFLGLIRIIVSLTQVVVLYCFTRPLLQRFGVAKVNIIYPLTTLVSLGAFLVNINLFTGVTLHLNGDALFKSINLPIHQLNYNAVPKDYIGRIRTLSDGIFYALGLILVGAFLGIARNQFNLGQVAWIAAGLTLLLGLVRFPMGRFYGQGLEKMIRLDAVDLEALPQGSIMDTDQSIALAHDLLQQPDLSTQMQGLDLALRLRDPLEFLPDIQQLTHPDHPGLRQKVLALLSRLGEVQDHCALLQILDTGLSHHRVIALEALIVQGYPFAQAQLWTLLRDDLQELRALAAVAILLQPDLPEALTAQAEALLGAPVGDRGGQAILRVAALCAPPRLNGVVQNLLGQQALLTQEGLEVLDELLPRCDPSRLTLADPYLDHAQPGVRQAALRLIGKATLPAALPRLEHGLQDASAQVRSTIIPLIAQYPQAGLQVGERALRAKDPQLVNAGVEILGQLRTPQAQERLYRFLTQDFELLAQTQTWQREIPRSDPLWQPLDVAIQDFQQQVIEQVLRILSHLGHARTLTAVNRILQDQGNQNRSNAVEVLASLSDRRFVRPLLPILEALPHPNPRTPSPSLPWLKERGLQILLEALAVKDRWIKIAAIVALSSLAQLVYQDADPVVRQVTHQVFQSHPTLPPFMNRILLLKQVVLFQNLTLDELQLISEAMEAEQFAAGQTIYTEDSWGTHFYCIEAGKVQLCKTVQGQVHQLKQRSLGDYFGEISLLDDAPHWDSAIALEESRILKLEKQKFKSLMLQRPHISLEICRFLSQRLREYDQVLQAQQAWG